MKKKQKKHTHRKFIETQNQKPSYSSKKPERQKMPIQSNVRQNQ